MTRRVGIFAGTFDPVHNGHTAFAAAALTLANLDDVYFLPEPKPRQKKDVTPLEHRLAMLSLALQAHPGMHPLEPQQDQFTIALTLPKLQAIFDHAELVLLFGSDVAHHVADWPHAEDLLQRTELVIAVRDGYPAPRGIVATLVPTTHAHVAASHVRRGDSNEVAQSVRDYIVRHGLYTL